MKLLTKEEEEAHYAQVVRGGAIGGVVGLSLGLGGVILASRRYPAFKSLSLPFRTFLVTSTATFGAIVNADRWGIAFQKSQDPYQAYQNSTAKMHADAMAHASPKERMLMWGRDHRYTIVFWSWVASMGVALSIVGRSKFTSTAQKLVQARVYAQGLTLAVLIVTAAFEMNDAKSGAGRWETVMVLDPEDPEHKHLIEKRIHKEQYEGQDLWKDMVAAEERRLAQSKKEAGEKPAEEAKSAQ